MARRGELQEVELLDADVQELEPPDRRRIPLVPLVAGVLVVVVGLVATQWVLTARERAAVARLAQVPGVIAPVDETLEIVRRVAAEDVDTLFGSSTNRVGRAPDGSQSYSWVDADGPVWTAELLGPSAALADVSAEAVVSGTRCLPDHASSAEPSTAARVVCLVSDGALVVDEAGGGSLDRVPATIRDVVVLSTADGSVLARWPTEGENVAVLPGDVVVLASASTTHTTVTGYDTVTGEQLWTRSDPLPDGFTYDEDDLVVGALFRVGEVLAYAPHAGPPVLLSSDGATVRTLDEENVGLVEVGGVSRLVLLPTTDAGGTRTTLLAPDGDPAHDVTFDGMLVSTTVDDGSVPGLLLSSGAALSAWDDRTGAARWSADVTSTVRDALVMRGRVFVSTSDGVMALDGRTGKTLWTLERESGTVLSSIVTDATHLLVVQEPVGLDGEPAVVAYDPVTGHEEFRARYPAGVTTVEPARDSLVGTLEESDEYAVLR